MYQVRSNILDNEKFNFWQSWGRSLIFDLKIKDPSDFADLFDDLDHTLGSDLINGDLDLKITL